jgi:hypothetical protein
MASEDAVGVSVERRGSSVEQPETSLSDEQVVISMEATPEQDAGSDGENPSEDTSDSGDAFDNGGRVKIGAEAAVAGVSYDFSQSKVTKAHITYLESFTRYFPKGFTQPASVEFAPDPKEYELLCSKISSPLAFVDLRTRSSWIFYINFRCNCIS